MSRLSTPILLALVAVLGLGNALTAPTVHADGDGELAPEVMPNALPPTAFLTGEARLDTSRIEGLDVRLERTDDDHLALVVHNPTEQPRTLARTAEVISTTGSMASRMGPMPMVVANVPIALEVAPGQTMRKVFGAVALQPLPEPVAADTAAPAEAELINITPFMSFASLEVSLDGDMLALVDPNPAVARGEMPRSRRVWNDANVVVDQTAALNAATPRKQARR